MNNIDIQIKKIDSNNTYSASVTSSNKKNAEPVSFSEVNKESRLKFCADNNISMETLDALLLKYPNLFYMKTEEIQEILLSAQNNEPQVIEQEETIETSKEENNNQTDDQPRFNHKAFSKLSLQDKANMYALELAKNKFIYSQDGTGKSIEEWNALSDEQRNSLINSELNALKKENSSPLYDNEDINLYLENKMTKLQAANYIGENIDVFNKSESGKIAADIHDYLSSCNRDNLVQRQNDYLDTQHVLTKAVIQARKARGENINTDGVSYNIASNEINQVFAEGGILSDTTKVEVQMKYLQDKIDKGIELDDTEKKVYGRLNKLVNSDCGKAFVNAVKYKSSHPGEQVNYGRLDALKNSEFGKDFEAAVNKNDKVFVVNAYLKKVTANLSSEEKAKFLEELATELMYDADNAELIADVHSAAIADADDATQNIMAQSTEAGIPELNAINSDAYNETGVSTLAATHEAMLEEDAERAEMLAAGTMDNLSNEKLEIVSDIYSSSKSENIQRKHADKALTIKVANDKDINTQRVMLENVNKNSNLEVRKDTAKRLDEAHKDNQLHLTEQFIEDKEVAKAMNAEGTLTRFDKDNQTGAFNMLKNRFEQGDFTKKEAINQLNTLSNQIKDCHKDNQLAMHNEIMQSKYSEVQEHAAGNIKDYDVSVQSQALDTVYESGNQKAIDIAVSNLEGSPACIQQAEYARSAVEAALSNNANILNEITSGETQKTNLEIKQKIAGGYKLSDEELANLSPQEKREYFANYFKKLPLEQKIKLLSSMPNGAQKKTIYVMIARTDTNLFNAIIKDKDRADMLLSMGLPKDVNNKIIGVVKFLAVSDVGYQNIAKKYDIEYNKEQKTNSSSYATNPYNFDTKEIYLKDKKGNLII